jgi:BolA family transcriptional regulator, general stress-responsive regulator
MKANLDALTQRLETLTPQRLVWTDDSHLHAGHAGAREGGHYRLEMVSARFAGMTKVARHRLIYDSLGPLGPLGVHALQISAKAPGEA